MIQLPLSRGLVALIDDEDAHLAAHKWTAKVGRLYDTPEEANLARLLKERALIGIQPRRLPAFVAAGLHPSSCEVHA